MSKLEGKWELANTEDEARQSFVRKYGREPERVVQRFQWWYAGPVREEPNAG